MNPTQAPEAPTPAVPSTPTSRDFGTLTLRRWLVFGFSSLLTLTAAVVVADLLWRMYSSYNGALLLMLILFIALFAMLSFGATTALVGFLFGQFGDERVSLSKSLRPEDLERPFGLTAVVYPVFNENPEEIFERVRAVYRSIERTGRLDDFEFYVLSDSTNPDNWAKEEFAWARLCGELKAFGKIFYRRRKDNVNKKAGNIADFCTTWGERYAYMVVMDADSVMHGGDIVRMAALMEKHPTVGLLQTAPRLVNAESLYGRIQQFAFRLYGDMFTAGLNFWQGPDGNYWGHNAIIRMAPFTDYCALPDLPGKEPFGGKILSHDFVEAALMRRAGWEVWLLWDVGGTYEEGPQSLIDNAKRDRRWLQGNLQHTWLLFAGGLRPLSRLHLLLGIMGYLASALWFGALLISTLITTNIVVTGLSSLPPPTSSLGPLMPFPAEVQGQIVFGTTLTLLFLPKLLALLQCILSAKRRRSFGGIFAIIGGLVVETVYSALTAPVIMLFHTKFILFMLLGKKVEWVTQQRGAVGSGWKEAIKAHGDQTLLCLAWLIGAYFVKPWLALVLLPVLGPVLISIPISVWSSRPGPGKWLRKLRILATPEELSPPLEFKEMAERQNKDQTVMAGRFEREAAREGVTRAIVDPYVNAVHVSLMETTPAGEPKPGVNLREAGDRLMAEGPQGMEETLLRQVASDPDIMMELHRRVWVTPFADLAPWWQHAIERYRRVV